MCLDLISFNQVAGFLSQVLVAFSVGALQNDRSVAKTKIWFWRHGRRRVGETGEIDGIHQALLIDERHRSRFGVMSHSRKIPNTVCTGQFLKMKFSTKGLLSSEILKKKLDIIGISITFPLAFSARWCTFPEGPHPSDRLGKERGNTETCLRIKSGDGQRCEVPPICSAGGLGDVGSLGGRNSHFFWVFWGVVSCCQFFGLFGL